jgi:Tfp pilus assembly protein PilV
MSSVEMFMLISCKRTSRASPLGGFTLVEVVISILLVAVTLVAALNTVGGVFRNYAIARERQQGRAGLGPGNR